MPGFPIRTSSDPRSVDSSPRHIAASHVLHRLPMPRHPPCALTHLQTQKPKFSRRKNCKITNKTTQVLSARCSQPLSTTQTPHPTTKMRRQHDRVASGPNSVLGSHHQPTPQKRAGRRRFVVAHPPPPTTGDDALSQPSPSRGCGDGGTLYRCSLERR